MHEAYIMYDVESVTIQLKGSSWISISYYLLRTGLHSSGLARAAIEGWLFIIYYFKNRNSFPFRHATRTNIWINSTAIWLPRALTITMVTMITMVTVG